jgi:hypothetical protein
MAMELRLVEDRLRGGMARRLSGGVHRVVYAVEGEASIDGERLLADEARFFSAGQAPNLSGEGRLWIWELVKEGREPPLGPGATLKLAAAVTSLDPGDGRAWLMRCDSVAFPAGGCALTHVHRGPGIRCLKEGSIRVDTEGLSRLYGPGEAWFESGPQPVFAQADPTLPTRFIRVMLLPLELRGQSSIRYVLPEDREKPKTQTYRGYCDEPIDIAASLRS